MAIKNIEIKGANQNNLKNIDIKIPKDKFVVLTGLSGSGKSTLAIDTIFAEGQRRYVESLSPYARQFLGQQDKPDVESIEGLSPAISIDQKTTSKNPRSTVATQTEIHDYLRLLYARVGRVFCPIHGIEIKSQSTATIRDNILIEQNGKKAIIMGTVIEDQKGTHAMLFDELTTQGFTKVEVNGTIVDLDDVTELDKNKRHTIRVVVDRIAIKAGVKVRLIEALENAVKITKDTITVKYIDGEEVTYSTQSACPECGYSVPKLEPRLFSFNAPHGACADCGGIGTLMTLDKNLVIKEPKKSLFEGVLNHLPGVGGSIMDTTLASLCEKYDIDPMKPWKDLSNKHKNIILYGTGDETITMSYKSEKMEWSGERSFEGIITMLERRYRETKSSAARNMTEKFMSTQPCPKCGGTRYNDTVLSVKVNGKNIAEFAALSVIEAKRFTDSLDGVLSKTELSIAKMILKEIKERLEFLVDVGLGYLTLDRSSKTLSGGEAQRIRLATQIGTKLSGVLYVLDEPSIGLHQRDNEKLINTMKNMTALGNTLLVVEHDEDTMLECDHLIDIGPGAGIHGGEVIAQGTPAQVTKSAKSLTGQYLSGKKKISIPEERRKGNGHKLKIFGARENNLKNIDVEIPLGLMNVITGVSGSGKSTLINQILVKELQNRLNRGSNRRADFDSIEGVDNIDKIVVIDQSPIGRTPRSNPATYSGVFDDIRDLYASTQESKKRGYSKGRFSFNVAGGRCDHCSGDGYNKIEMHFLPDVFVPCEVCSGKRYNEETLQVLYKGKNIADVLEMPIEEALVFFKNIKKVNNKLQALVNVGLGYITLGQASTTLSGGEAQRVKLASELHKRSTGKTLYVLDEPTTGLHFEDVNNLLEVLQKLVDQGNSMIIIEHNLDVVKVADHVIDIGPEGGNEGGQIVAEGIPEDICNVEESHTGRFLKRELNK